MFQYNLLISMNKQYDHQDDQSQEEGRDEEEEHRQKMKQLEEEYNHAKITADVNELYMHHKKHEIDIKHLQKDMECRISESQLSQIIALINAGVHTDPNIIKLLKTKQSPSDQEQSNRTKMNAILFARKLNQMSQSLSVLLNSIKKVESKVNMVEADLTAQVNQKHTSMQMQIEEARSEQVKENMQLQQKMELLQFELGDKMRDIDTKINWRLNQFKQKIDDKISEELVMSYLQTTEKKIDKSMKQYQLKSNISPERIQSIEKSIQQNRITTQNGITQCQHKLTGIRQEIDTQLLKIKAFEENKLKIQKRMEIFNSNFSDVYIRAKGCESRELKLDEHVRRLLKDAEYSSTQLKRINNVLINLKIGEDFQKMLAQMNPTKVLELQDRVDEVRDEQTNIFRSIEHANRQIKKINAKADVLGVMQPNKAREKLKKEQLEEALTEYLSDHQFSQKIANIDRQLGNYKLSVESVNLLSKQVARLQKESDTHQLHAQIRCLEQNFKKQLLLIHNQLKGGINYKDFMFTGRPSSKGTSHHSITDNPVADQTQGRSFSVKKIHKITSFFDNSRQKSITDRKMPKG